MVAEEAAKREGVLLAPNSQELLPISFQTERKKKKGNALWKLIFMWCYSVYSIERIQLSCCCRDVQVVANHIGDLHVTAATAPHKMALVLLTRNASNHPCLQTRELKLTKQCYDATLVELSVEA